jgi:hypothetical protein
MRFGKNERNLGFLLLVVVVFWVGMEVGKKNIREGLADAASCKNWSCDIEGQLCPSTKPGSEGKNWCCKDGQWGGTNHVAGNCAHMTECANNGCLIGGWCYGYDNTPAMKNNCPRCAKCMPFHG